MEFEMEPLPVLHLSPRTIQEMAATQCAFVCWRNIIMRNKGSDADEIRSEKWLRKHSSFICTDIAPFPAGVRWLINHKIQLIGKQLKKWCEDHSFLKLSSGVTVNCVVLNPAAGDICYKRTAKNLLTANPTAFSLKEQFEIACKYCFEEDVERLWLLLKKKKYDFYYPAYGFNMLALRSVGAVDYWCSKMRGELRELYKNPYERQDERSPEWFVLENRRSTFRTSTYITNWAQVEYFWHKLNREEQSSIVRDILLDRRFMKNLILKLDDEMMVMANLTRSELESVFEILAGDE